MISNVHIGLIAIFILGAIGYFWALIDIRSRKDIEKRKKLEVINNNEGKASPNN